MADVIGPQHLHILRLNGVAQSFFTVKENALKEMARTYLTGIINVSVETLQARGTEGVFDRGVEVFLSGVDEYMSRSGLTVEAALMQPALLFPCLMLRRNPVDGQGGLEPITMSAREVDELVGNVYTMDAGEDIHRPIRPDTRPPLRPFNAVGQ